MVMGPLSPQHTTLIARQNHRRVLFVHMVIVQASIAVTFGVALRMHAGQ